MIQACRLLPLQLKAENERQRRNAGLSENNPYLANLGVRVFRNTLHCTVRGGL